MVQDRGFRKGGGSRLNNGKGEIMGRGDPQWRGGRERHKKGEGGVSKLGEEWVFDFQGGEWLGIKERKNILLLRERRGEKK